MTKGWDSMVSYMSKIAIGAWVSKTETYGPLQNITMI